MSVVLPRKRSSCWPLPWLSGSVNSMPFRIESLAPGVGVRCLSPLSLVSWRRRRIPPPLLLGLRASLYLPYEPRAQIAMGDCYVLCRWSGVTWTARPHIVLDVSGRSSPQDVARRRSRRTVPPSGSRRRYLGRTSFRGDP